MHLRIPGGIQALSLTLIFVCATERARPRGAHLLPADAAPVQLLVDQYCVGCHNPSTRKGDLDLDSIRSQEVVRNASVWEKVVRKLRARQMPPAGTNRPDEGTYNAVIKWLSDSLDRASAARPDPG